MEVFQQKGRYAVVEGFEVLHFEYEDHWTFCLEPWHEEERGDADKSIDDWYEQTKRSIEVQQPNYSNVPTLYCANCNAPAFHDYLCGECREKD